MTAAREHPRAPDLSLFVSAEHLTDTDLWHLWKAVAKPSGDTVLVKLARDTQAIDRRRLHRLTSRSTELQTGLDRRIIVTPLRCDEREGAISIAYPYLAPSLWQPLTAEQFCDDPLGLLVEAAFVVDYLHHYRLVHGDLKLSNFMYRQTGRGYRLCLVDNDFTRAEFDGSDALVLGTPDHIAPEILANDPPCVESDSYSFGCMLSKLLTSATSGGPDHLTDGDERKLRRFVDECTRDEATARPRSLLAALHGLGVIDDATAQHLLRRLLKTILVAQTRTTLQAGGPRTNLLYRIMRDTRLFGLPDVVTKELEPVVQAQPESAVRLLLRWLRRCTVDRSPDYWRIDIPNDALVAVYRLIHKNPSWPGALETGDDAVAIATAAAALAADSQYLPAWLHLRALLGSPDLVAAQLANGSLHRSDIEPWYDVISQVRQPAELVGGLTHLFEHDELPRDLRLLIGFFIVRCRLLLGQWDDIEKLSAQLIDEAEALEDHTLRADLIRHRVWVPISRGDFATARDRLTELYEEARAAGDSVTVGHTLIELMKLDSQSGEYDRQHERLKQLEQYARDHEVAAATRISMHQGFAVLYQQQGRYHLVQRHARAGLRLCEEQGSYALRPFLYEHLALAGIRLGRYDAALRDLTMSLADRCDLARGVSMSNYLRGRAFLEITSGRYFDGRRTHRQVERYFPSMHPGERLMYWQIAAELACWQGDRARLAEAVEAAQALAEQVNTERTLVELGAVAILDKLHNLTEALTTEDVRFVNRLIEGGHHHNATRLLNLMLLAEEDDVRAAATELAVSLPSAHRLDTAVPLGNIFDKLCRLNGAPREQQTELLKECYIVCNHTGTFDIAVALCRTLATQYRDSDRPKVARRYYEAAARHAREMGNDKLVQMYDAAASSIPSGPAVETLLDSVRSMSGILASLEDRPGAMQRLIRYAIDLTGAERGVLFDIGGDRLRPSAYISCDSEDLKDITDFSRSIVRTSVGEARTVTIDNAVEDDRTNQYKSVIAHNIRAVICTPIVYDGQLLGALYLDHHNLPGLFTDDDIQLVETIANFLAVGRTALDRMATLSTSNDNLRTRLRTAGYDSEFVGKNVRIQDMLSMLPRIAATNAPVLIIGETGTGKECLADMIHSLSARADKPMVKLNCASFAPTLIESELFGVAAGAATGVTAKAGKFEAADRGSLFLDEIGDMSLEVQAKVLRVLESQRFERVGSTKPIDTDIRFIYATNQPLERLVEDGRFRRDLYYRLSTFVIDIPPLRNRRDDIPLLIDHFAQLLAAGGPVVRFAGDAMEQLVRYDWPGNVRQLKNFVDMMVILDPGSVIQAEQVRRHLLKDDSDAPDNAERDGSERDRILEALTRHAWNQTRAARDLKLPLSTLRNRMKRFGLRRR